MNPIITQKHVIINRIDDSIGWKICYLLSSPIDPAISSDIYWGTWWDIEHIQHNIEL